MSREDAVKTAQITSIANAVERMEHIISQGEPRSSIRGEMLAEVRHVQSTVEKMDGMLWSNPWLGDVTLGDVAIPQEWLRRGGTLVRTWPRVQAGDIVTYNGKRWQVVVNFVHGGISGRYTEVFSVYVLTRYYLGRSIGAVGFDADTTDDTVV